MDTNNDTAVYAFTTDGTTEVHRPGCRAAGRKDADVSSPRPLAEIVAVDKADSAAGAEPVKFHGCIRKAAEAVR